MGNQQNKELIWLCGKAKQKRHNREREEAERAEKEREEAQQRRNKELEETLDRIHLRGRCHSQTNDLREYPPHPMTTLSPLGQFKIGRGVIILLFFYKSLKIESILHAVLHLAGYPVWHPRECLYASLMLIFLKLLPVYNFSVILFLNKTTQFRKILQIHLIPYIRSGVKLPRRIRSILTFFESYLFQLLNLLNQ